MKRGEGDDNEDGDVAVDVAAVATAPMMMNVTIAVMNFPSLFCSIPLLQGRRDNCLLQRCSLLVHLKVDLGGGRCK